MCDSPPSETARSSPSSGHSTTNLFKPPSRVWPSARATPEAEAAAAARAAAAAAAATRVGRRGRRLPEGRRRRRVAAEVWKDAAKIPASPSGSPSAAP